jgi:hypothetical protein
MSRATEVAWAVGLFEGEGCFDSHRSGKRRADGTKKRFPRMSLASSDRDVVFRFFRIVASGSIGRRYRASSKRKWMWKWEATCQQARKAYAVVWPYLGRRRAARAKQIFKE